MPALIMHPGIIYGPVKSRRLGWSLGINLLPVGRKICPFHCVYCECGDTTELTDQSRDEQGKPTIFPSLEQVEHEVRNALLEYKAINAICFSGHGEPSLHPQFPDVVRLVKALRDRYQPDIRVGVLSSSALLLQPRPREGIDLCDLRMMKLDAADEETFHAIDRPVPHLRIADIIDALAHMSHCIIQTCLVDGKGGTVQNVRGEPWNALVEAVRSIAPDYVQLYRIDRETPEPWVQKVSLYVLSRCASDMRERAGVPVDAY